MERTELENRLNKLMDELAAVEHDRWSHWQRYMHGKCEVQPDGSLLIPAALVEKWNRQIEMPFSQLSESEKESDREQVRRYLPVIAKKLEL